ncbi:MAG: ATP-binding protein [Propionibacteriaceae bacterium]|nr:ATP-binding protein [Propionibacteriaceae bacterium]
MDVWLPRLLDLEARTKPRRATILYGPRRVGKTSLVQHWLDQTPGRRVLRANGDDATVRALVSGQDTQQLLAWVEGYEVLFLDEAQRIPEVGWGLKILVDARPDLTMVVTGSASFALAGVVGEPLTGRQTPLPLYPISVGELPMNDHEIAEALPGLLVYGMYPEVRTAGTDADRRDILRELSASYLLKDILDLERIKGAQVVLDLLTLLALQVGSLVSVNELASTLGIDAKTVARYLDLLQKAYVLYNLRGFSRNLRQEVTRTSKYYFYDTGVRNAVLNNFNPVSLRDDVGALWENFLIMERIKARTYARQDAHMYFWRSWQQQEIDLIEDADGHLGAYEFTWNPRRRGRCPAPFAAAYPDASYAVITSAQWLDFARYSHTVGA